MEFRGKIFSGRANPELTFQICEELGVEPGRITIRNFSDGEIWVKIEENIRGDDVFIVQPTNPPAENMMELLLMIDAAKRASARRITAVIPYYGYARQDRKDQPRVPISARLMVDLIVTAGASRILTMDLHSTQIQGFVNIPFDHLYAKKIFLDRLRELMEDDSYTVVSPDVGGIKFARSYARILNLPFSIIDKRRTGPNRAEVLNLIGEQNPKNALIIDDMIDTAGTIEQASLLLKERGCGKIIVVATHGLFSGPAVERVMASPIDRVIVTNSVEISDSRKFPKLEVMSAAPLFAEAIKRINNEESISILFEF